MFTSHLVSALLLGLDGFLVCLAVGALPARRARRVALPLSLGVCDGLATWVGSAAGMEGVRSALAWGEWLGPAVVAGYGLYVLYLAWRCRGLATGAGNGALRPRIVVPIAGAIAAREFAALEGNRVTVPIAGPVARLETAHCLPPPCCWASVWLRE